MSDDHRPGTSDNSFVVPIRAPAPATADEAAQAPAESPPWLRSSYWAPTWTLSATGKKIEFDILLPDSSVLTDSQNRHLLETIKRCLFSARQVGKTETDAVQVQLARNFFILVSWMLLNDIRCFSRLGRDEFEQYKEECRFGAAYLLDINERLADYLSSESAQETPLPTKWFRSCGKLRLVHSELLQRAGIDQRVGVANCQYVSSLLANLARAHGLDSAHKGDVLASQPEHRTLSVSRIAQLLEPWDLMFQFRRRLTGDRLPDAFSPFAYSIRQQVAKQLGEPCARTENVPAPVAMRLLDAAARWVLVYGHEVLDVAEALSEHKEAASGPSLVGAQRDKWIEQAASSMVTPGPASPYPLHPFILPHPARHQELRSSYRATLGACLSYYIPAAAFIIIATFTARRKSEVLSLRAGCVRDTTYGRSIRMWVAKTHRAWDDAVPCPVLVEKAVGVLTRWSQTARAVTGDSNLFQFCRPGSADVRSVRPDTILDRFVAHVLGDEAGKYRLRPHQLRRFFAMMYMWRYELGELTVLSDQLRHFDTAMTRTYVTEIARGEVLVNLRSRHNYDLLSDLAKGKKAFVGRFGRRLTSTARRLYERHEKSLKLYPEAGHQIRVKKLLARIARPFIPMPWGDCYCSTRTRDLQRALCSVGSQSTSKVGPDLTQATPEKCIRCRHCAVNEDYQAFWNDYLRSRQQPCASDAEMPAESGATMEHTEVDELSALLDSIFKGHA